MTRPRDAAARERGVHVRGLPTVGGGADPMDICEQVAFDAAQSGYLADDAAMGHAGVDQEHLPRVSSSFVAKRPRQQTDVDVRRAELRHLDDDVRHIKRRDYPLGSPQPIPAPVGAGRCA